ncbi:MAG: hypothetical protein HOK33_00735 [Rhodobiaceae bacterium]|jgi:hypothetical protein|nr:hypothetical protein [Rhodobiaceae bacterium]MBT5517449.1 hypothetical protein [Rhodobiaceae bacterium]
MAKYSFSLGKQANGDYWVHVDKSPCPALPNNSLPLGRFENSRRALQEAKKTQSAANGCKHCCPECHTK